MKNRKTYNINFNGIDFFVQHLGAEVEGCLKWYVWSNDVNIAEQTDQLWYTKQEAMDAIYDLNF